MPEPHRWLVAVAVLVGRHLGTLTKNVFFSIILLYYQCSSCTVFQLDSDMLTLNGIKIAHFPWRTLKNGDVVIVTSEHGTRAQLAQAARKWRPDIKTKTLYDMGGGSAGVTCIWVPGGGVECPWAKPPKASSRPYKARDPKLLEQRQRRAERRAWHRAAAEKAATPINPFD